MKERNDGGPAYPASVYAVRADMPKEAFQWFKETQGMSLRDYLAGQALVGLLAGPTGHDYLDAARKAYKIADAMLLERE